MTAEPVEIAVGQLFELDNYLIPLYQRNYAWRQGQTTQLIRDVWDFKSQDANYYIGTLVVHETNQLFETIDGQQRLTTLNILFSVLRNEFKLTLTPDYESRLRFESRPLASATLKKMAEFGSRAAEQLVNTGMMQAYLDIAKEIRALAEGNLAEIEAFAHYLKQRVLLLRVAVPPDTDLNHYFEIMNNRGEQLEKHEILKAELMKQLKDDSDHSTAFAQIWDACASMDRYMLLGIPRPVRDELFGTTERNWDNFPEDFESVSRSLAVHRKSSKGLPLASTLLQLIQGEPFQLPDDEQPLATGQFSAVIDFPNFLLQVLRIWVGGKELLDDKRLLPIFYARLGATDQKAKFVKDFAYELLRTRYMFDKYVIKRDLVGSKESWSLKNLKMDQQQNSFYYHLTFFEELNDQLIMLLAMFHVSFPQQIYKHWLSGVLSFLRKSAPKVDPAEYINYLEELSAAFYFDRSGEHQIDYQDIIFKNNGQPQQRTIPEGKLNAGTDVPNFVFNRLDYLLWRSIVVKKEAHYQIDRLSNFEFTSRSSVEHYFPQNPMPGVSPDDVSKELRDNFGNLCLISNRRNSALSNNSPQAKAEHYGKSGTIESLKQRLMMQQSKNWKDKAMLEHQKDMVVLLASS